MARAPTPCDTRHFHNAQCVEIPETPNRANGWGFFLSPSPAGDQPGPAPGLDRVGQTIKFPPWLPWREREKPAASQRRGLAGPMQRISPDDRRSVEELAGKPSEAPPSLARHKPGQRVGGDVYGAGRGHLLPIQAGGGHPAADGGTCLGARLREGQRQRFGRESPAQPCPDSPHQEGRAAAAAAANPLTNCWQRQGQGEAGSSRFARKKQGKQVRF